MIEKNERTEDLHIDLLSEQLITLSEAARLPYLCRNGKPPAYSIGLPVDNQGSSQCALRSGANRGLSMHFAGGSTAFSQATLRTFSSTGCLDI